MKELCAFFNFLNYVLTPLSCYTLLMQKRDPTRLNMEGFEIILCLQVIVARQTLQDQIPTSHQIVGTFTTTNTGNHSKNSAISTELTLNPCAQLFHRIIVL